MAERIDITLKLVRFSNLEELSPAWQVLVRQANEASETSYSPYSKFRVGCALRLAGDEVIMGSNQENMAYPSGLCAERTAFFSKGSHKPNAIIEAVAVVAFNEHGLLQCGYSCGACRQSMLEYETRQGKPIALLMSEQDGSYIVSESIAGMLPLNFAF